MVLGPKVWFGFVFEEILLCNIEACGYFKCYIMCESWAEGHFFANGCPDAPKTFIEKLFPQLNCLSFCVQKKQVGNIGEYVFLGFLFCTSLFL